MYIGKVIFCKNKVGPKYVKMFSFVVFKTIRAILVIHIRSLASCHDTYRICRSFSSWSDWMLGIVGQNRVVDPEHLFKKI